MNLAFAKALYSHGCSVHIMDIALHRDTESWRESIQKHKSDAKVAFHKADLSQWAALENIFDVFADTFGGVPYIVYPGAGIYEPVSNCHSPRNTSQNRPHRNYSLTITSGTDTDIDNHYKILDINLLHPLKLSRIAIRRMLSHHSPGIMCCVSSIGAQKPSITTPFHHVSKTRVSSFVRCIASLHSLTGIRVVAVAPGAVAHALVLRASGSEAIFGRGQGFMLEPEDVARGMLAVCCDEERYPRDGA